MGLIARPLQILSNYQVFVLLHRRPGLTDGLHPLSNRWKPVSTPAEHRCKSFIISRPTPTCCLTFNIGALANLQDLEPLRIFSNRRRSNGIPDPSLVGWKKRKSQVVGSKQILLFCFSSTISVPYIIFVDMTIYRLNIFDYLIAIGLNPSNPNLGFLDWKLGLACVRSNIIRTNVACFYERSLSYHTV